MRDYSKVSGQFWTGKTGRALRGDMQAQIVALYLMTSPHANMIGVFNCPFVYIAHETGSPLEGALMGLKKLCEGGFCTYDEDSETVWVHEMAKFQIGDGLKATDNRVKDIQKQYENLPEGQIKRGFYDKYHEAYHLPKLAFDESPSEAPCKPLGSQKQEQEQKQEQKLTTTPDGVVVGSDAANAPRRQECPHQEIIALYHEVLPMCPQVRDWTPARAVQLRARWNEEPRRQHLGYWRKFFEYVADCDFLVGKVHGKGDRAFIADLEWMTKSANFTKIREGKYVND